jgi:hypothetical protein
MPSEDAEKPAYRECVSCGRRVFVDLLDEQGVCEYCREVRIGAGKLVEMERRKKARPN